ncbi:hypothetical protein RRG08_062839 [Elysia crispata]|uniref:Mutator-like transposase domain-containing protein n=1 Tax=Elysia crispata TaxID=231223 RepID=A0AAE0Z9J0_9GAST|nr:hypothetical protein RRG08_062839 [Elysia crispata]
MMEVEAAKTIFFRSLGRGLRYTTLVADGDCKTFNELQELRPYGDTSICKEECTNHVSKRLGTNLRNLVAAESKRGTTLGGRKQGSLTQAKIALLQSHYKKAVASKSATVGELSKKIWTFYHASSTDCNPQHHLCPTGTRFWCFYNHTLAFVAAPSPHVAEKVRGVYERLTAPELLQRCLKGLTQNANEAIHSTIWSRCPKHLFAGRRPVEIATTIAVGNFNSGSTSLRELTEECGYGIGKISIAHGLKRDFARIKWAEKAETVEAKRRRDSFTTDQVKGGFRGTGIFPYNMNAINTTNFAQRPQIATSTPAASQSSPLQNAPTAGSSQIAACTPAASQSSPLQNAPTAGSSQSSGAETAVPTPSLTLTAEPSTSSGEGATTPLPAAEPPTTRSPETSSAASSIKDFFLRQLQPRFEQASGRGRSARVLRFRYGESLTGEECLLRLREEADKKKKDTNSKSTKGTKTSTTKGKGKKRQHESSEEESDEESETCPGCGSVGGAEQWVCCDVCGTWCHVRCTVMCLGQVQTEVRLIMMVVPKLQYPDFYLREARA